MAKKLYGAAAAAVAKKRARRRRRSSSRALVRRGSTAVVSRRRRRRSTAVAVVGRRRRSSGAFGSLSPIVHDMGYSAGYGYLTKGGQGSAVAYARMILDKVTPDSVVSSIGAPLAHGLILHFGAKYIPGLPFKKHISRLGRAALLHGAHNLGASGFDLQASASMQGYDDGDDAMSGAMDADYEEVGYDDDEVGYDDDEVGADDDPGED